VTNYIFCHFDERSEEKSQGQSSMLKNRKDKNKKKN